MGPSQFTFATWLFVRLLALAHLIAFASFWAQAESLVGSSGLLPAERYLAAVREQLGNEALFRLPTLCWWFGADAFLHVLAAGGIIASVLLFAGVAPPVCLLLLWVAYLSISAAGQMFYNFQWDTLLLETTVLSLFIVPWRWLPLWRPHEPPALGRYVIWWLLFRLMFLAGVVKLTSGDPTWRDLTALTFHFETQPLPTPLAWYSHQLPAWWHRASCAAMFAIELVAPLLLFGPRLGRHFAALVLAAFMGAVALTGNYTFFNLLAIALCLSCLDDAWWQRVLPSRIASRVIRAPSTDADAVPSRRRMKLFFQPVAAPLAWFVFAYTGAQALTVFLPAGAQQSFATVGSVLAPFRSLNNYGLFAVMTRPRYELIFEGSDDGRSWHPFELPHKPGAVDRRPTWVAPHQPRLDWQLWFAALGNATHNRWVLGLCEHLLRGNATVLRLFETNPFLEKPPRFVRVVRYEYHFTDRDTRARSGHWWTRTPVEFYVPQASLR